MRKEKAMAWTHLERKKKDPNPNPNQTLKTNCSKNPPQKLKLKLYSYRVSLVLSEYNFTLNFCRGVFEQFKVR